MMAPQNIGCATRCLATLIIGAVVVVRAAVLLFTAGFIAVRP